MATRRLVLTLPRCSPFGRASSSVARGAGASLDCVDSTKIAVAPSKFGLGTFARCDIQQGELVEYGVARRLPVDGQSWDIVFTWSANRDVWATCTGASVFYNMSLQPNTEMTRLFDKDRYFITATRDIPRGEALTHTYKSLSWRKVFKQLPQHGGATATVEDDLEVYNELPVSLVMHDKVQVDFDDKGHSLCVAKAPIARAEIVERGVFRVAPLSRDVRCDALFHVGGEVAAASGLLMIYKPGSIPNLEAVVDSDGFELRALRDIELGEELSWAPTSELTRADLVEV